MMYHIARIRTEADGTYYSFPCDARVEDIELFRRLIRGKPNFIYEIEE